MGQKNPYSILGVTPSADAEEIKAAYRDLVKRYHPDIFSTYLDKFRATKKMQEINEAYALLRDPLRRNQFDKNQATSFSKQEASRGRSSPPRSSPPPRRKSSQPSDKPKWSQWAIFLGLFFLWAIVQEGFSVFIISIIGLVALTFILVGLACGFYGLNLFQDLSLTSQHTWRDLAIRLAVLVVIVVLPLYSGYRAGVTSPWLVFGVLFISSPWGWLALALSAIILSEIVALFLYIYRAGKVAKTTEILAGD